MIKDPIDYLLTCLGEECNEVGQAAAKVLRFGPDNSMPGVARTNRGDLIHEFNDVLAVMAELADRGFFEGSPFDDAKIEAKRAKLRGYLDAL